MASTRVRAAALHPTASSRIAPRVFGGGGRAETETLNTLSAAIQFQSDSRKPLPARLIAARSIRDTNLAWVQHFIHDLACAPVAGLRHVFGGNHV